jgi:putative membrane protein
MTNNHQDKDDGGRFAVQSNAQTHFAWMRTRMSAERTLMAWMRTAVSLIGFGFTIVQFFERLKTMAGVAPAAVGSEAPRYLGLALIGAGILGLIIASWEYQWFVRYLWSKEFESIAGIEEVPWHSPTVGVTVVLLLIGIFAFGAVLLRLS